MSGSQFGGGSSGSSSSSRRGKKSGSQGSDKPKQPQRGLGVAQLEKIRLHSQMEEMKMQAYAAMQSSMGQPSDHFAYSSSSSQSPTTPPYCYPPTVMMGIGDVGRANLRFGETRNQPTWNPSHGFPASQPYGPPGMATRHFFNDMEDPEQKMRNNWLDMAGSSGQNSGSDDGQDLDLELKL